MSTFCNNKPNYAQNNISYVYFTLYCINRLYNRNKHIRDLNVKISEKSARKW